MVTITYSFMLGTLPKQQVVMSRIMMNLRGQPVLHHQRQHEAGERHALLVVHANPPWNLIALFGGLHLLFGRAGRRVDDHVLERRELLETDNEHLLAGDCLLHGLLQICGRRTPPPRFERSLAADLARAANSALHPGSLARHGNLRTHEVGDKP